MDESIKDKDFHGIIKAAPIVDMDLKNTGRYRVYIPALMQHIDDGDGIWCRNRVHPWRYTFDFILGSYGQYFPLQDGTKVLVHFLEDDYNTGEIREIVADQDPLSIPFWSTPDERDHLYTLVKTPVFYNLFNINEMTLGPGNPLGQPYNSVHFYYNCQIPSISSPPFEKFGGKNDVDTGPETDRRTKFIIDEDGVHFWTADNHYVTVDIDANIAINKKVKIKIGDNTDIHIKGDSTKVLLDGTLDVHVKKATKVLIDEDCDIHVVGNTKLKVDGTTDVHGTGVINVKGDGSINVQGGPLINLNCGTSAADAADAADAEDTKGYNEKEPDKKEMSGIDRVKDIAAAVAKKAATKEDY